MMGNSLDVAPGQEQLAAQLVRVGPFLIDRWVATNEEFRSFVRETKYTSESEKFGWSFVLSFQATAAAKAAAENSVQGAAHWLMVPRAYWRAPHGPGSDIAGEALALPAVHLSWNDAAAYCAWRGARLPTESEWELAARGGLAEQRYPWGDASPSSPQWRMNVWQGEFPDSNSAQDGFALLAPAKSFAPNGLGLYNTLGNVWEWTATRWAETAPPRKGEPAAPKRVLRGGSFLDSADGAFNHLVNVNTRMGNTEDSASSNTGVRCAASPEASKGSSAAPRKGEGYQYKPPPPQKQKAGMPDQATLQKVLEEEGVEGLKKLLGNKATIATAGELRQRQEELQRRAAAMASEQHAEGQNSEEHIEL